jgi:hypothetical protein
MSAGIAYANKFNENLFRCNRERMTTNELQLIADISSADHTCTLLAYGQCSECTSYISIRYGRFCIIRIDNLIFDYMSELRAAKTVANAFISTHQMHVPEVLQPGNPQRLSKRHMDLQALNDAMSLALQPNPAPAHCDREHLTDHNCPRCVKPHLEDHICDQCIKPHLDRHVCKPCTLPHLTEHHCAPCEEPHLRDHTCATCKLTHLFEHNCPECTEPHLKDHKCITCTKSHLDQHQCPKCTEPHTKDHRCPPCIESHTKDHVCKPCNRDHLSNHRCKPCTKQHLDTHECRPCKEIHLTDHTCPPCLESHLSDHQCPECSQPHLEPLPAYTSPQTSFTRPTAENVPDTISMRTRSRTPQPRTTQESESSYLHRGRQPNRFDPTSFEQHETTPTPRYERRPRLPPMEAPAISSRHQREQRQPEIGDPSTYQRQDDEASITSSTRRRHRREESTQPTRHHRRNPSRAPPPPQQPKPSGFLNALAMAASHRKGRPEDHPPSPTDERKHRRHDSHNANY